MESNQTPAPPPDIPLPPPPNGDVMISYEDFEKHKKDFKFQKGVSNWTFGFLIAILIVCVTSFATFILDAYRFHYSATKNFETELKELKADNNSLNNQLLNQNIKILEDKINSLELKNSTIFSNIQRSLDSIKLNQK